MESLFDTVAGLPVHPLVVHFAIVLLPLATLGVLISIFFPKIRSRYLALSLIGVFIGTGATFVAKQSGEALAERVGLPVRHADLGENLLIASVIFFLLAAYWYWRNKKGTLSTTHPVGLLVSVVGVVVIGLSVVTGHTGAESVWLGKLNPTSASEAVSDSETGTITMTEVALHNSPDDCWSAIDGKVYNLTEWISEHPGGSVIIESLCGKDGSAGFNSQHGDQERPIEELARYLVGTLKAS